MTATVPEVITASLAGSATGNYTVTTSLVPSDIIAVVVSCNAVPTVTGLGGATWATTLNQITNSNRVVVRTTTGVTGTGTVTVQNNSAFAGGVVVYVIRGLTGTTIVEEHSAWDASTTASNNDEFAASQSFGVDQVAVLVGTSAGGTTTFPSNSTPSSGSWTVDLARTTTTRLFSAHVVGTSAGTVQSAIRSSSSTFLGIACIVFGDAVTTPPLTSTFVGWGNPIF